jgi:hypothetical protein
MQGATKRPCVLLLLTFAGVFFAAPVTGLAKPSPVKYVLVSETRGSRVRLNAKTGKLKFTAQKGHYGRFTVVVRHGKKTITYHFTVDKPKPPAKVIKDPSRPGPPSAPGGPVAPGAPAPPPPAPPTAPAAMTPYPVTEFRGTLPANRELGGPEEPSTPCGIAASTFGVNPTPVCDITGSWAGYDCLTPNCPTQAGTEEKAALCEDFVTVLNYLDPRGAPSYVLDSLGTSGSEGSGDSDGCYAVTNTGAFVLVFNEQFIPSGVIAAFQQDTAAIFPFTLPVPTDVGSGLMSTPA